MPIGIKAILFCLLLIICTPLIGMVASKILEVFLGASSTANMQVQEKKEPAPSDERKLLDQEKRAHAEDKQALIQAREELRLYTSPEAKAGRRILVAFVAGIALLVGFLFGRYAVDTRPYYNDGYSKGLVDGYDNGYNTGSKNAASADKIVQEINRRISAVEEAYGMTQDELFDLLYNNALSLKWYSNQVLEEAVDMAASLIEILYQVQP